MLTYPDYAEKNIVVCNTNEQQRLSFINDNIVVKDEADKIILQQSCYKTFALWIIGSITITSGLLERSKKFAFSVFFFNYSFKCYGVWAASTEGNFVLRGRQYQLPAQKATEIAAAIIANKIQNQQALLQSIRAKNETQKRNTALLKTYAAQAAQAGGIQNIMGIEGTASRLYFEAWIYDTDWKGRKPRAKRDILNVLMDIGYTYLFNMVEAMLLLYGFDVYKGVLHQNFYQRKSLVCDIVEPFRVIVDKQLKNAWHLGQIKQADFKQVHGQYVLDWKSSKPYTQWLLAAILAHKADIFIYVQQYYHWFMRDKPVTELPQFKYKP